MNEAIVFNVSFNGLGVIRALGENDIPVRSDREKQEKLIVHEISQR